MDLSTIVVCHKSCLYSIVKPFASKAFIIVSPVVFLDLPLPKGRLRKIMGQTIKKEIYLLDIIYTRTSNQPHLVRKAFVVVIVVLL